MRDVLRALGDRVGVLLAQKPHEDEHPRAGVVLTVRRARDEGGARGIAVREYVTHLVVGVVGDVGLRRDPEDARRHDELRVVLGSFEYPELSFAPLCEHALELP